MARELPAVRVNQWLPDWDDLEYDEAQRRRKPEPHFHLLSMPAGQLRRLAGIYRRSTERGEQRSADISIQRRHNPERSAEIRRFVRHGYPWSELSTQKQTSGDYDDLRKPGWLPTAIVINVLTSVDDRHGKRVDPGDLVSVSDTRDGVARVRFPTGSDSSDWTPKSIHPIEVIDGQHRLWAFESGDESNFELPVVAFYGLDISWQAYVFWTVNIKPKKINASLAFDLYPLLRAEDWLERADNLRVYRETRAQEITELLWSFSGSPWYRRINMLGEGRRSVSQAAWIRSLTATFIKSFAGRGVVGGIGGLYGELRETGERVLPWNRIQQAALIIYAWQCLADELQHVDEPWVADLRRDGELEVGDDPALAGDKTLLNSDIGVRGFLYVLNDIIYVVKANLGIMDWTDEFLPEDVSSDDKDLTLAIADLKTQPLGPFVKRLAATLATYDWRTSAAPGVASDRDLLIRKQALRGSSGYKVLRSQLLEHVAENDQSGELSEAAEDVMGRLGMLAG